MKYKDLPAIDLYLCLFLLGALSITFSGHGSTVDENMIIQVTESLAERGELNIDNMYHALPGPDGRFYSCYGIGFPLLMLPFYFLGKGLEWLFPHTPAFFGNGRFFMMLWGNLLLTVLTGWLFYRLCRMLDGPVKASVALALALIFATPYWPYSQTLYRLTAAGAVLTAALILMISGLRKPSPAILPALACLVALGLNVREDLILAFLLMGGYVLWRGGAGKWGCAASLAAGAVVGTGIWGVHNYVRFGCLFLDTYGVLSFDFPWILSLPQLALGKRHGLIVYAPLVLLLPFGYSAARQAGHLDFWWFCAAVLLAYGGLYGKSSLWHGGVCWGPRLMYYLLPLGLLPGVWIWKQYPSTRVRWMIAAGFLWGLVMNWPGVYSHKGKYQDFFSCPSFFSLVNKPVVHPEYITFDELDLWWVRMIKLDPFSHWPVLLGALILFTAWSGYRLWRELTRPLEGPDGLSPERSTPMTRNSSA